MKQKLARYNLQYCAVNSQLVNHDASLDAVRKAHALMVECVVGGIEEFRRQFGREWESSDQVNCRLDLLVGLAGYDRKF
jgi:hypothetical protein